MTYSVLQTAFPAANRLLPRGMGRRMAYFPVASARGDALAWRHRR